jgi:dipeptidase E
MAEGKIFCGGSFGALWVFDAGHSDSMDPDTYKGAMTGTLAKGGDESTNLEGEAKPWEYVRAPALGFLPGICCPHYDKTQSNGVLRAVDVEAMMKRHPGEVGLTIDHWAALRVEGGNYTVISTPGKPGSVLPQAEFSPGQKGVPGVWTLSIKDG